MVSTLRLASLRMVPITHYFLLVGSWALFGASHSFLAGTRLDRLFGPKSRIVYNTIALAMMAIPVLVLANSPATPLWIDPSWLQSTRFVICTAVILAFIHTLKFYSISGFLGLKIDTWPLTFSPWHCWIRHPWYFLTLVFIWMQAMTDTWFISALCITLYLVVGSKKEEKRILVQHPGSYAEYSRIVPGLIPWRGRALDEAMRLRLEAMALRE